MLNQNTQPDSSIGLDNLSQQVVFTWVKPVCEIQKDGKYTITWLNFTQPDWTIVSLLKDSNKWSKLLLPIDESSFMTLLDYAWIAHRRLNSPFSKAEQNRIIDAFFDLQKKRKPENRIVTRIKKWIISILSVASFWQASAQHVAPNQSGISSTVVAQWTATQNILDAAGTRNIGMNGLQIGPLAWSGNSQSLNLSLMKFSIWQTDIEAGWEYARLHGLILRAGGSIVVWDDGALSLHVRVGKDISELLAQAGYKISDGAMIKVSFAHQKEMMDFLFPSWPDSTNISQDTIWFTLRIKGNDLFRFFELSGYRVSSGSKILGDKDYVINTQDIFQLLRDSRHIAWATAIGIERTTQIAFQSGNNTPTLDLTAGRMSTRFDTIVPTPSRLGQSYELE